MNDLPPTALIAIGTITAALIAGAFTYLSLVISKEQKVSEFRQSWIDELRAEIAQYCSAYLFLASAYELLEKDSKHEENSERASAYLKIVEQPTANASGAYTSIVLRLNPDDPKPKFRDLNRAFLDVLKESQAALRADQFSTSQLFVDRLQEKARPILKAEWDRVREGELTFRLARYGALAVLILAGAVAYYFYMAPPTLASAPSPPAAEKAAAAPQAVMVRCG